MNNLLSKLNITEDEYGKQIIEFGDNLTIKLDVFIEKFEDDYSEQDEYNSLYNSKNATKAWKDIFDDWKQKGILD